MKDNLHELVFVVDQSASIEDSIDELTKAFKSVMAKQKKVPCDTNVTVSVYGSDFKTVYDAKPIAKINCKEALFDPSGVCPFLDSAAKTIDDVGARLSETEEADRPAKVIVTLLVFGRDNASKKHTYEQLKDMIYLQSNTYKWKFFLITDFSIVMEKLGISEDDTIIVRRNEKNAYADAYTQLNEKITRCRTEALKEIYAAV